MTSLLLLESSKTFNSSLFCTLVTAISSKPELSPSSLSSLSDELAVTNVVAFAEGFWALT